jgi:hypothetical protein
MKRERGISPNVPVSIRVFGESYDGKEEAGKRKMKKKNVVGVSQLGKVSGRLQMDNNVVYHERIGRKHINYNSISPLNQEDRNGPGNSLSLSLILHGARAMTCIARPSDARKRAWLSQGTRDRTHKKQFFSQGTPCTARSITTFDVKLEN